MHLCLCKLFLIDHSAFSRLNLDYLMLTYSVFTEMAANILLFQEISTSRMCFGFKCSVSGAERKKIDTPYRTAYAIQKAKFSAEAPAPAPQFHKLLKNQAEFQVALST